MKFYFTFGGERHFERRKGVGIGNSKGIKGIDILREKYLKGKDSFFFFFCLTSF